MFFSRMFSLVWEAAPGIGIILAIQAGYYLVTIRDDKPNHLRHHAGLALFFSYLLLVLIATINYQRLLQGQFGIPDVGRYNLIPLEGIKAILKSSESTHIVLNLLGNVLMFLPFGFLIPALWEKWRMAAKIVPAGVLFSFLIEAIQFFTGRGTDVDDILLNTLGTACGYFIYWSVDKICTFANRKCQNYDLQEA